MDSEGKKRNKFAVGDRVVYRAGMYGDGFLNGEHGTVIFVDGTRCPYTVEFDRQIQDGVTDNRALKLGINPRPFGARFCAEENLDSEVSAS